MMALEAIPGKLYSIPKKNLIKAELAGNDTKNNVCFFLIFDKYNQRQIIMVKSSEEIEESK